MNALNLAITNKNNSMKMTRMWLSLINICLIIFFNYFQMPTTNGTNGHQNGMNGHQNGTNGNHKVIENQKPIPKTITSELLSNPNFRKNGTLTRTPTPDYNKKTDAPAPQIKSMKDEKADMESLESYKLKNPSNVLPKPPSNYFVKAPNGTATMKKHARPVSVTIGEYAYGGATRREPTKLDFLNGVDKTDGLHNGDEETSISNRLQSELAMTLSRSNLRKKTEALVSTVISFRLSGCFYITIIIIKMKVKWLCKFHMF